MSLPGRTTNITMPYSGSSKHSLIFFVFLRFFGMLTFLKVFIEVVTILLFYVLVLWPWGMWDLSCQEDQTLPLTLESKVLTTGPPGKSLPTASSCLPLSLPATGNIYSDFHGKTSLIFSLLFYHQNTMQSKKKKSFVLPVFTTSYKHNHRVWSLLHMMPFIQYTCEIQLCCCVQL